MGSAGTQPVGQWGGSPHRLRGVTAVGVWETLWDGEKENFGDSTRLLMGCLGEKAVTGKGIGLRDLGRT